MNIREGLNMSANNPAIEPYAPEYEEQEIYVPPPRRTLPYIASPGRMLLIALGLGWSVDILFYGKALGISVPLFVLLLVGALVALGWVEGVRPDLRNLWLVVPLVFFASMVFVRANLFLSVLNVCACIALLGLLAYYYANGDITRLGLFGYPIAMLLAWINSLILTAPLLASRTATRNVRLNEARRVIPVAPVLRGLALALPLVLTFTILLASADTIFADYLSRAFNLDFLRDAPEMVWRLVIILCAAWVIAGGLAYALRRGGSGDTVALNDEREPGLMPSPRALGTIEANTVLIAVNLLFLAFVAIQFAYLFSGQTLARLEDSDYKHYARKGFGELIAVSVLTMGMILVLRWLARHDTDRQRHIFNALSTVMIGLSLVILSSAWQRMSYWEEVIDYISTALRLYVRVFIVWLGLTYVWLLTTLWVRPALFALGAFVAAIGFLCTLNVMNPDDNVVQYNVERAAVRELYIPYLDGLSEDAVPALIAALDTVPASQKVSLQASLSSRLRIMEDDPNRQYWQSFNLARAQAYDLLVKNVGRFR